MTFVEPGTGLTPNGNVTLHFKRPDGSEATTVPKVADSSGAYSKSYTWSSATALGTWTYWAIDENSGASSNQVSFTVTP